VLLKEGSSSVFSIRPVYKILKYVGSGRSDGRFWLTLAEAIDGLAVGILLAQFFVLLISHKFRRI
jgi:hypothetical protein